MSEESEFKAASSLQPSLAHACSPPSSSQPPLVSDALAKLATATCAGVEQPHAPGVAAASASVVSDALAKLGTATCPGVAEPEESESKAASSSQPSLVSEAIAKPGTATSAGGVTMSGEPESKAASSLQPSLVPHAFPKLLFKAAGVTELGEPESKAASSSQPSLVPDALANLGAETCAGVAELAEPKAASSSQPSPMPDDFVKLGAATCAGVITKSGEPERKALAEETAPVTDSHMGVSSTPKPPMEQLQQAQDKARADIGGEAVSPKQDKPTKSLPKATEPSYDHLFKEGADVLYWSKSAKKWFPAVILGKHQVKGKTFYDLSCKKGARASSIRLPTDTLQVSNGEASHVKSAAGAARERKRTAKEHRAPKLDKKKAALLRHAVRGPHRSSSSVADSLIRNGERLKQQLQRIESFLQTIQTGRAGQSAAAAAAAALAAADPDPSDCIEVLSSGGNSRSGGVARGRTQAASSGNLRDTRMGHRKTASRHKPGGSVFKINDQGVRSRMPRPRFDVGQKVRYWSENSGKWLKAQIIALNSHGSKSLYDLDCKRRVHVRRLRPYIPGHVPNAPNGANAVSSYDDQSKCSVEQAGSSSFFSYRWLPLTGEQLADWKFAQRVAKRRLGSKSPDGPVNRGAKSPRKAGGSGQAAVNDGLRELQAAEAMAFAELDAARKALALTRRRQDAAEKTAVALHEAERSRRRKAARAARDKIELLLQGHTEEEFDAAAADDEEADEVAGPVNCLFPGRRRHVLLRPRV